MSAHCTLTFSLEFSKSEPFCFNLHSITDTRETISRILKKRPDLRIVISSATLDAELFHDFFNVNDTSDHSKDNVAIMSVKGRSFPGKLFHELRHEKRMFFNSYMKWIYIIWRNRVRIIFTRPLKRFYEFTYKKAPVTF